MVNLNKLTPSLSMLQSFEAAARLGNFTLAADELSVTQGAISRQIQSLESLLDLQLFRRSGRHLELTEVGHRYALDIAPAIARIRGASARALAFRGTGGQLNLGVLPTFASRWLLPRLVEFYELHPDINVHLHSRVGEYALQDSGLDAAINVGVEPFTGLVSYPLIDEEMIIVASPKLLAKHPIGCPSDIFRYRLLHNSIRTEAWRELATLHKVQTHRTIDGPQFETTLLLIQAAVLGIGLGLISRCLIADELDTGELIELPYSGLSTHRRYCLLHTPEQLNLPSLIAFRNWITNLSKP